MNLLELKKQAGIDDNPDQEGLDLFAELIVQECAKLVEDNIDPQHAWITPAYIKEHFGVEE